MWTEIVASFRFDVAVFDGFVCESAAFECLCPDQERPDIGIPAIAVQSKVTKIMNLI